MLVSKMGTHVIVELEQVGEGRITAVTGVTSFNILLNVYLALKVLLGEDVFALHESVERLVIVVPLKVKEAKGCAVSLSVSVA